MSGNGSVGLAECDPGVETTLALAAATAAAAAAFAADKGELVSGDTLPADSEPTIVPDRTDLQRRPADVDEACEDDDDDEDATEDDDDKDPTTNDPQPVDACTFDCSLPRDDFRLCTLPIFRYKVYKREVKRSEKETLKYTNVISWQCER